MIEPPETPGETYKIGYKKPPPEHRFKPGQPSRNPRGRPRGKVREHALLKVLREKVPVMVDGKRKRITLEEVISRKFVQSASSGSPQAFKVVLQSMILLEKASAARSLTREEILQEIAEENFRAESQKELADLLIYALNRKASEGKPERAPRSPT